MPFQLSCKACGDVLAADEVNIEQAIAKCRRCNAVFSFLDQLKPAAAQEAAGKRPQAAMPASITVQELGSELTITRRWLSAAAWFFVLFCIAWNGFLVFWYYHVFTEDAPRMMKLFPLGHVAVGVGLAYWTLAQLFNRTYIQVRSGRLQVKHRPVPWFGNRDLPTAELRQLYCTSQTHRGRRGSWTTYDVNAATADGRKVTLLSGLTEQEQALFIEQKIEERLGIQDRPVAGELPR